MKQPAAVRPRHVAIILDGNRRWAKRRGLPAQAGHYRGLYYALMPTIEEAIKQGVEYLTVFAFSTENWNRKQREVNALMKLFEKSAEQKFEELLKANIRLKVIGQLDRFPDRLQELLRGIIDRSENNTGLTLTLALSYGGRQEVVSAAEKLRHSKGKIDEEAFANALYEPTLPDVDLLIRTSGEQRLSGFLLWQAAYAEIYFTDTLWPDFGPKDLARAIKDFMGRQRRFGT